MIAEAVLDTNVLVDAVSQSADEAGKRDVARDIIQTAAFGLSGQILQEFWVTTTRKIRRQLSMDAALDRIKTFEEVPIDAPMVRHGAEIAQRYGISYWDGAILAAAERLQSEILYTEDLSHGQLYGSVRVVNPFLSA